MRRLLLLFLALAFFGTAMAQRIRSDRTKEGIRSIQASEHNFFLSKQQCYVSLSSFVNGCQHDTIYTIDVNAYLNNTDSCKLTFTLFDEEEISLIMASKSDDYNMIHAQPLMDLLFGATIIRRFIITKEQMDKIFSKGVLGIELTDGIENHWHSWKKDKLGVFLKRSYDKIQERFKKKTA